MSNGWAIVAIPSENDYAWRISSEKVPHMTMLFLGEQTPGPKSARMFDYMEHVFDVTNLGSFGLPVERRGVLGDDEADVLFFEKAFVPRTLLDIRTHLLANRDIREAYDSAFQYPEWTPHLTLGYPKTPAKEDTRENPGINWVNFDRVALWTGDYEGPVIWLKDLPLLEGGDFSMSDETDEFLSHYGIKGMKWGVRRTRAQLDADSDDAANKKGLTSQIKKNKGSTDSLSNKELQSLVTRLNLERQYSALTKPEKTAGRKFVDRMLKNPNERKKTMDNVNAAMAPVRAVMELRRDLETVRLD